ncbi:Trk family potassium uptake protein [Candidatus Woesearchaeota archaeon]|nr:Trk family potassium uptake protein [Candidatus Woesearchaeota archaeon]
MRFINPFVMIICSFAASILIGAGALMLPIAMVTGERTAFLDALFTATSATTVTGLTVKDTGAYWSTFGHVVILLLVQLGGLGYMTVMSIGFAAAGQLGLRSSMLLKEQLNLFNLSDLLSFAKRVWWTVCVFEVVGALLLFVLFVPSQGVIRSAGLGLFHSISAFNNAGFDLFGKGQSMTDQHPLILAVIMILIFFGGIGFAVMNDVIAWVKREHRQASVQTKIVLTTSCALIVAGALVLFTVEYSNPDTLGALSLGGKVMAALFQSVSARTAGFNSIPISGLHISSLVFLSFLMFVGASPGGTGGGVKTSTFAVAVGAIWTAIRGRQDVEFFNRRVSSDTVKRAFVIICLGLAVIFCSSFVIASLEQLRYVEVLFESTSAFGVVGLSTGITSSLGTVSKLVIVGVMFVGRVSPLVLLTALFARKYAAVRLPEEQLSVG